MVKPFPAVDDQAALLAAAAALAGHRQGRFWAFRERLLARQAPPHIGDLREMAQDLGLDVARFNRELAAPAIHACLLHNMQQAKALGIEDTPALLLNGARLADLDPAELNRVITEALPKNTSAP